MSLDLGNASAAALGRPVPSSPARPVEGFAGRLARVLFHLPARLLARLERNQRERDALVRYAMAEGRQPGLGRSQIDRAVLLSGRADILFPSYFVNADRR